VYFKGISVKPGSSSMNNFTGPVIYTVTGRNGSVRPYTVTVKLTPSGTKDITRFSFPEIANTQTIIGAVPDADGSYPIAVSVPAGTVLSSLTPDISYTGVSINPPKGSSGVFNTPQEYTVSAEDGTAKTYKVTVYVSDNNAKLITSFIFDDVPLFNDDAPPKQTGAVRSVGSIDQSAHTVTVVVPAAANVSGMRPTLTYIGKSITGPAGGDQTANPFRDGTQNFSGPQTYTVKDQNGNAQPYIVTVLRQSAAKVRFEGEIDRSFIAGNTFDQSTGIVTVTANDDANTGIAPPYEWYVDGFKQTVSTAEPTFTLNAGDGAFTPGRHEIMLSGKKDGLHYTNKIYFVVSE
jgi:hypothetical protein